MKLTTTQTPAIDKAIRIFDFLSQQAGATFSQIYQGVSLPKSTASSLLAALVAHRLLRLEKNKYFLGVKLYELGHKAEETLDIRKLALEPLTSLRDLTKLTCHLGILDGATAIYLLKLESPNAVVVRSWEGKKLTLYSSGLGKALLAWLSEEEVDSLLPQEEFPIQTAATLRNKTALKKELATIRKRGWALDNEEDSVGVCCIAAPVFNKRGQTIAAISLSGVSFLVAKERIPELAQQVKAVAQAIMQKIS